MPKYPKRENTFFGIDRSSLGWGILGGVLLAVLSFSAGMYYGYGQGYQDAREAGERRSITRKEAEESRSAAQPDTRSETGKFETVITREDLRDTATENSDRSVSGSETTAGTFSQSQPPDSNREPEYSVEQSSPDIASDRVTSDQKPKYTIQVLSSRDRKSVLEKKREFDNRGFRVTITQKTTKGDTADTFYRLQLGEFATKERAESRASELQANGVIDQSWPRKLRR